MSETTTELQSTADELELGSNGNGLIPISHSTPECLHNFTGDQHEQWRMASFATGTDCKPGADIVDQVFSLKYWFVHMIDLTNQQGEMVRVPRTVLIDGADNAYGFVSEGVYKSLRTMVSYLGKEPFDPTIPIVVKSQQNSGGRKFYNIQPAREKYVEEE